MRFQQDLLAIKPLRLHDDSVAFDECAFDLPLTISVGNNTQFAYDAQDRCVKIEERTNSTLTSTKQFIWCGTERCEERDASGNVVSQFFGLGQKTSSSSFYYNLDHLGSVREVTNSSGTIVTQMSYTPWGEASLLQGSSLPDFGYAGYYNHPRSGLNLTLYRAYSPGLGRWLSRDPLGESAGINLYGYVMNNPVSLVDLLGLDCCGDQLESCLHDCIVSLREEMQSNEYTAMQSAATGWGLPLLKSDLGLPMAGGAISRYTTLGGSISWYILKGMKTGAVSTPIVTSFGEGVSKLTGTRSLGTLSARLAIPLSLLTQIGISAGYWKNYQSCAAKCNEQYNKCAGGQ